MEEELSKEQLLDRIRQLEEDKQNLTEVIIGMASERTKLNMKYMETLRTLQRYISSNEPEQDLTEDLREDIEQQASMPKERLARYRGVYEGKLEDKNSLLRYFVDMIADVSTSEGAEFALTEISKRARQELAKDG